MPREQQPNGVRSWPPLAAITLAGVLVAPSAPAATLSGELTVAGGKKLRDLIVFLEPMSAEAAKAAEAKIVTQKGRVFKPGLVVVVTGGKVTFVNDEDKEIDHNVYSLSKTRRFDIGLVSKGVEKTIDFPNPGTVKYYCSVHKNMEGTVVVLPSPFFAVLDEPGEFTLEDVPAGKWRVNAAVSHRRYTADPVEVAIAGAGADAGNVNLQVIRKKRK